ncbi:right-handed parallel beta-helix repeat-containing protein [Mucilaginibacter ginsenosidivorans]|uniref:T9SS type A sorting domain-containing protein n=1 Tax=Mucilaginibacter ginsenosidivorans TaxID=398053 RepID=A0A5B8UZC6_9SPHI|nr:right-handed parallel beta-helix repeat-containing protein [Mucilaginibacter ginsenosidivorans]QEC64349.1 T9SS type A sorting domain-containing protein [Mucilaginibacter ginsenosidivorans]
MLARFLTFTAVFLLAIQCHAINYYLSTSTGNDTYTYLQAQSKTTPWKTIAALNTNFSRMKPGDSILFKCGETFTGSISITKSGIAGSPIVISSWGTGARPVITGLVPTGSWVSLGGGVYSATCPLAGTTVNMVTLNGVSQPIGRYPNANATNGGYLNIDSHTANTQVVSSQLNTAVNWTGADIVFRKNHWVITHGTVTSNTATVVNYSETSAYQPINNWGFFFQNHPATLDLPGEWYYDAVNKKILMYFGATTPTNGSVMVAGYDYLVNFSVQNYITIKGLAFVGSNLSLINLFTSTAFTVTNCTLSNAGQHGLYANVTTNLVVSNCSVQNTASNGIVSRNQTNTTVSNDTLTNIGIIAGMGVPNDAASYEGIIVTGPNTGATISNNSIVNVGYNGIDFGGDNTIVKNNYVDNFELIKDDGGAIYTYAGDVDSLTNHVGIQLTNNILLNTVGAPAGSTGVFPGCASGIYLDDNTTGVTMTGNSIANCLTGVYFHHARNNVLNGNTIFNNRLCQVLFQHNGTKYTIKNNTVTNNIIYSVYKTQFTLSLQSIMNDIPRFATWSGNYYSNTIDNIFPISYNGMLINLVLWQHNYNKDLSSYNAISLPLYNVTLTTKRTFFNNGAFNKNINGGVSWSANGNFKAIWDNTGVLDAGTFKGYFSFISGSAGNNPMLQFNIGPVTTTAPYMVKFSMKSTHGYRRLAIFLLNNSAPYNQVSETKYLLLDSNRTENTLMITPTSACANTAVVLRLENEDVSLYLDNLNFYSTTSTLIDPNTQLLFAYNNTMSNKVVKLASTYVDAKNTVYKVSTTLAPFTSVLLIKKQDTTITKPPIVYSEPKAANDILAFNATQKSNATIGVYPNPASEYIIINLNGADVKNLNIKLLNTRGDVIMNQQVQVTDTSYRLDLNQKPKPGTYFLQVSGDGLNQASKVVII